MAKALPVSVLPVWCLEGDNLHVAKSVFGKRDLLAIFHIKKINVKCGMCLHKSDCRETTLSNAANHF